MLIDITNHLHAEPYIKKGIASGVAHSMTGVVEYELFNWKINFSIGKSQTRIQLEK